MTKIACVIGLALACLFSENANAQFGQFSASQGFGFGFVGPRGGQFSFNSFGGIGASIGGFGGVYGGGYNGPVYGGPGFNPGFGRSDLGGGGQQWAQWANSQNCDHGHNGGYPRQPVLPPQGYPVAPQVYPPHGYVPAPSGPVLVWVWDGQRYVPMQVQSYQVQPLPPLFPSY